MSEQLCQFLQVDLLPLSAGLFAAVACGVLGNFLVLRRLSLMGDAISHSVMPGLVIAFLISGTRSPLPMFLGAAMAGLATVVLVELVKKLGRVESGAAMGVVFSVLFALGVLLMEQAAARHVDLDADCVLHGQLETLFWFPPGNWSELLSISTLSLLPRQVTTLAAMMLASIVFVTLFFKELRIAAFDPALATTQGFHAGVLHYLLMVFVAAATVASFEAVGSILVIAMLICPAATARLLTDRLMPQVLASIVIAAASAVLGYMAATLIPAALGADAVSASGMMTVVAGALLAAAAVLAPRHGWLARWLRHRRIRLDVALDDLLAALFRAEERASRSGGAIRPTIRAIRPDVHAKGSQAGAGHPGVSPTIGSGRWAMGIALGRGWVTKSVDSVSLTPAGRQVAEAVVRRHRLWESYLVDEADVSPDRVHQQAEQFEHVPVRPPQNADTDPHGRRIPGNDGRPR